MGPAAHGPHLRDRHPDCLPGQRGPHPLHVSGPGHGGGVWGRAVERWPPLVACAPLLSGLVFCSGRRVRVVTGLVLRTRGGRETPVGGWYADQGPAPWSRRPGARRTGQHVSREPRGTRPGPPCCVHSQVFPDVLHVREPGLRRADLAADAQLAPTVQVLPLVSAELAGGRGLGHPGSLWHVVPRGLAPVSPGPERLTSAARSLRCCHVWQMREAHCALCPAGV